MCPGLTHTKLLSDAPANAINDRFAQEYADEIEGAQPQKVMSVSHHKYVSITRFFLGIKRGKRTGRYTRYGRARISMGGGKRRQSLRSHVSGKRIGHEKRTEKGAREVGNYKQLNQTYFHSYSVQF